MASNPSQELVRALSALTSKKSNGAIPEELLQHLMLSLLNESSNLCGRIKTIKDLSTDLRQHRAQLQLVKGQLEGVEEFMNKHGGMSNACSQKRRVYNEELTKLVEGYFEQLEKLVQAIYNDAKKGANGGQRWSDIFLMCVQCASALSFIGALRSGNVTSIIVVVGTGFLSTVAASGCGMPIRQIRSEIDMLLGDAEKFQQKVSELRNKLQLQSIELKMDDAVSGD